MAAGRTAGVCTTQCLLVGEDMVSQRNMAGVRGARSLLNDPAVECAIIEQPRQGILDFGHPCDMHDVGVLLNVQDDHIGIDGIATLDDMARLKAEVLRRARSAIVINAEDRRCLAVRELADCPRHLLVARDPETPALRTHLTAGGEGVYLETHDEEQWIVMARGEAAVRLIPVLQLPSALNGRLSFNISNAMFAAAIAWAQGLEPHAIRGALAGFANSAEDNPGRYNFIDGLPYRVLLDYAHNPEGMRELLSIVDNFPVAGRRRLLNLKLGNRHKAHFQELAPAMARTFDTFVLGCDERPTREGGDYGKDDPVALMLAATSAALRQSGVGEDRIVCEAGRPEVFRKMFELAQPGDLVVILAEPWEALEALSEVRRQSPVR
jgi:cyanophycin synthetase